MADQLHPSAPAHLNGRYFLRRTRVTTLILLAILLVLCLVVSWTTRGALERIRANRAHAKGAGAGGQTIVDVTPWNTAQTLAAMAVSAEEKAYAQQAERLADHEVDQAFSAALREATIDADHRTLSGEAQALAQKVSQLQQTVAQDQALVRQLSPVAGATAASPDSEDQADLEIAKAQLQLDSDQLTDAQHDLSRASGDERDQIQSELAAREQAMKKFDSQADGDGQVAVLSASKYGTLAGRLGAWHRQAARSNLLQQAWAQAQDDVQSLTAQHNALETKADTGSSAAQSGNLSRDARLTMIRDRTAERQLLSIYDDRIQTGQQLAAVYGKWQAQLALQHRSLLHLILLSCAWVLAILIAMLIGDWLVRRAMEHPALDRRQWRTLRNVLELAIQIVGGLCILMVIFGAPRETPTILGLTTAALTIALQDFVLAFFGWFVLMGKKGIRVGDTVEINGVGGEVIEIGLMTTTLLETGKLADKGYPTGRRISFMNGFSIRGQYFNFSTAGQWMWDEFVVPVPASTDANQAMASILKMVEEETAQDAHIAEQEWKRSVPASEMNRFHATPAVNLRPSGKEIELQIRFVTRASERFETRNRLYPRVAELLHAPIVPPTQNET